MRKIFFILSVAALVAACGNNSADSNDVIEDTTNSGPGYSWEATLNDSTGRLEVKKTETAFPDSLSVSAILSFLNNKYTNVKVVEDKLAGDTVFVKIPEATYLTQQMGSSGPTLYLADLVYNLTELPGIRFVYVDLEEGDHASPGTYSRDSFKDE
ncbi:MAG: hypothetical protein JNM88_07250 [Chitinophagaceae bacterium]|nr:hypothetical protein [Chitinophagaceae bacterium]